MQYEPYCMVHETLVEIHDKIFTPLQLVLNHWLNSISWLDSWTLYRLQVMLYCFSDTSFNGFNAFYTWMQSGLSLLNFDSDFIVRFNAEFETTEWSKTVTRWQIVSMCLAAGFPWRIIYDSLSILLYEELRTVSKYITPTQSCTHGPMA